jgi:succinyl-diaminopimelate desuccinylase
VTSAHDGSRLEVLTHGAVSMTRDLIRIDSESGGDGQRTILHLGAEYMRAAGFDIEMDTHHPQFMLATTGARDSPHLLMACHVDTVPAGSRQDWTHDPHAAVLDASDRLFGRGACDMKSGTAAAMTTTAAAGQAGVDCALLLTTDEEIGSLGAKAAVGSVSRLAVGAMVIPEPSRNEVFLGHRGAFWLDLIAQGVAAHGSTPELGSNAALTLAAAVLDLTEAFADEVDTSALGRLTINVGAISAGSARNIVPDRARAQVDIRYADDGHRERITDWLAQREDVAAEVVMDLPPLSTSPEDTWITSLPVTAVRPAAPFFTDAAYLHAAHPRAPIAIWGPGDPGQAHSRDESVHIGEIAFAVQQFEQTLAAWPRQVVVR